jgi:hypothetical protein
MGCGNRRKVIHAADGGNKPRFIREHDDWAELMGAFVSASSVLKPSNFRLDCINSPGNNLAARTGIEKTGLSYLRR